MKNNISKWLLALMFLASAFIAYSCSMFRKCDRKPDFSEYHLGLFDSIPEGTQAVFESNTGKLDTLVYGKITKDTIVENLNTWKDPCDDQYRTSYFEYQKFKFKHHLGFSNIEFYRRSGVGYGNGKDNYVYHCQLGNGYYLFGSYLDYEHNQTFQDYHDVVNAPIIRTFETYGVLGSYIMSKSAGLLQVKFKNIENPSDSVFTFKYFIP